MHGYLIKDINLVRSGTLNRLAIYPLKIDNEVNTFLINPNIILYFVFSLNIYEYL